MISLNPYQYQQMQAAGASNAGVSFGAGQQQFEPQSTEEKNIFASENNVSTSSVQGLSGVAPGNYHGVNNIRQNQGGDVGLVERLDRLDAAYQKPNQQNEYRANKLDLYA